MMKKFFYSIGLSCCLAASVFASDNTVDRLNSEITNLLLPFQNQNTSAKLKFDTAEIDKVRATNVAFNGLYNKIGSKNTFDLKVDNLSYDYGDGKSPTTTIKGSIGFDFTKLLSREDSNQIIPTAIEFLEELVKSYTEEYGDAIFIKGVVTSTSKDNDGNYTGLTALLSAKIDLDKLPEEISRNSVMATDSFFSITLNLKTGVAIDSFVVSNPEYWGFQEDELGWKEILENLLEDNENAKRMAEELFRTIDSIASYIVEMDNSSFLSLIPKTISFH